MTQAQPWTDCPSGSTVCKRRRHFPLQQMNKQDALCRLAPQTPGNRKIPPAPNSGVSDAKLYNCMQGVDATDTGMGIALPSGVWWKYVRDEKAGPVALGLGPPALMPGNYSSLWGKTAPMRQSEKVAVCIPWATACRLLRQRGEGAFPESKW